MIKLKIGEAASRALATKSRMTANSKRRGNMAPSYEERPYKKARLFDSLGKTIILVAGKEGHQKHFTVHKKILCEASPIFKAHCKPEWMKHEDKVIKLPEDNADVIQMLIFWIYHNQICIYRTDNTKITTCEEALNSTWGLFAQLYVIAQKYQMSQLQNDAIDALLGLFDPDSSGNFTPWIISWVYENTTKGDNLRKLIFRIARQHLDRSDLATFCGDLCPQFLFDMTYAAAESGSDGELEDNEKLISYEELEEDFCAEYHHHNFGEDDENCEEVKAYVVDSDDDEDESDVASTVL